MKFNQLFQTWNYDGVEKDPIFSCLNNLYVDKNTNCFEIWENLTYEFMTNIKISLRNRFEYIFFPLNEKPKKVSVLSKISELNPNDIVFVIVKSGEIYKQNLKILSFNLMESESLIISVSENQKIQGLPFLIKMIEGIKERNINKFLNNLFYLSGYKVVTCSEKDGKLLFFLRETSSNIDSKDICHYFKKELI